VKTSPVGLADLQGVFAQPRLVLDDTGEIDWRASQKEVESLARQGVTRFVYCGDGFSGLALESFGKLTTWLQGFPKDFWVIPGVGPDWNLAEQQAEVLAKRYFPCVLFLAGADLAELGQWEVRIRSLHTRAKKPLALALRSPAELGPDPDASLQVVLRLMREGVFLFVCCKDTTVAAWAARVLDSRRVVVAS